MCYDKLCPFIAAFRDERAVGPGFAGETWETANPWRASAVCLDGQSPQGFADNYTHWAHNGFE